MVGEFVRGGFMGDVFDRHTWPVSDDVNQCF